MQSSGSMHTKERHHSVTPESVSKKWNTSLKRAKDTIAKTTQACVRSAVHPLGRRHRTDVLQMHCQRLNATFYTDTMFSTVKSLEQNICAQAWTNGEGHSHVDPLRTKKDACVFRIHEKNTQVQCGS